jgi:hypothetical protein
VDSDQALASARKLAALDFDHMLPYHGEYLAANAAAMVRRDIA